jgi:hypothetical protein
MFRPQRLKKLGVLAAKHEIEDTDYHASSQTDSYEVQLHLTFTIAR